MLVVCSAYDPCFIMFVRQVSKLNCTVYEDAGGRVRNYQAFRIQPNEAIATSRFGQVGRVRRVSRLLNTTSSSSPDVSVITHLSIDRHYLMQPMARRWSGPIVFVIYYPKKVSLAPLLEHLKTSRILSQRANVQYIAVMRRQYEVYAQYPTNILRNIALRAARTKYVLMLDADFIPNEGIYDSLVRQMQLYEESQRFVDNCDKVAFVIPAFETNSSSTFATLRQLPDNKTNFLPLWLNKHEYAVFREKVFAVGHGPTKTFQWASTTTPYEVAWQPGYEPYIVAEASKLPLFDERFFNAFDDKVTYFYKLAAEKFRLIVLPHDFLIHIPHFNAWRIGRNVRRNCLCFGQFESEFFKEIGFCPSEHSFCNATANDPLSKNEQCATTPESISSIIVEPKQRRVITQQRLPSQKHKT